LEDGAVSPDGRVWGSYLHGLFDDEPTRRALLEGLRGNPRPASPSPAGTLSLDHELDRLADHLEKHLDLVPLLARLVPPGNPT
jgi:adenosylcobyric acid synthase